MRDTIDLVAEKLVRAASAQQQTVSQTHNGIVLTAEPNMKAADVVSAYLAACRLRDIKNSRNSSEGREMQAQMDALMQELDTLNFKNMNAVLQWIARAQPLTDNAAVQKDAAVIIRKFTEHGFAPQVNRPQTPETQTQEAKAREIISIALVFLQDGGAIHHSVASSIELLLNPATEASKPIIDVTRRPEAPVFPDVPPLQPSVLSTIIRKVFNRR